MIRNNWTDDQGSLFMHNWEGMEDIHGEVSYKIGFVLNLDAGTLDVYKSGRRLGTAKTGLFGEYCWVVALSSPDAGEAKTVSINR